MGRNGVGLRFHRERELWVTEVGDARPLYSGMAGQMGSPRRRGNTGKGLGPGFWAPWGRSHPDVWEDVRELGLEAHSEGWVSVLGVEGVLWIVGVRG